MENNRGAPISNGQTIDHILSHVDKEGPSPTERLTEYELTHRVVNHEAGLEIARDIEQRTRSANK